MIHRRIRLVVAFLLVFVLSPGAELRAVEDVRPIRGLLIEIVQATPETLSAWKASGGNAVAVPLDESIPRARWLALAEVAGRMGLDLYGWIEVGRNPALADAHPEWMAGPGGHHDDWRRRFPDAPRAGAGEVIKAWPWVPVGYAPALEAHTQRLAALLDGLPGSWTGVFLNDLQAGPSSCGCGNDQCRWALDYGSPSTAARTPGDDAAARLVNAVRARYPGKGVIPVWVTECETGDLPANAGGNGRCGAVRCAQGDCWPRYARALEPLAKAAPGPLAVALWTDAFGRDPGWVQEGLSLFLHPPRGEPIPPERVVAILPGSGVTQADRTALVARVEQAKGGWVIARTKVEQAWEPRVVKVPR